MKTVKLTKSEIETLEDYLNTNPCAASCIRGYKYTSCIDMNPNGTYKCKLMQDTASIRKKLGLDE